ncbi:PTPN7 isoform 12 [Pongo abelii]|uniref:PTPN7 isoform 12 n=1 Tax=Pongo abelii TaxID=9601 RepID=A0A2J8UXH6_PONAB|nr:PTPN7 isoform 12 [Pongo abelii]
MVQAHGGRSRAQPLTLSLGAAMTQPPPAKTPAKKHVRLQERTHLLREHTPGGHPTLSAHCWTPPYPLGPSAPATQPQATGRRILEDPFKLYQPRRPGHPWPRLQGPIQDHLAKSPEPCLSRPGTEPGGRRLHQCQLHPRL